MVNITNYLPIGPNHPVSSKSEGRIMVDITNPPPQHDQVILLPQNQKEE